MIVAGQSEKPRDDSSHGVCVCACARVCVCAVEES